MKITSGLEYPQYRWLVWVTLLCVSTLAVLSALKYFGDAYIYSRWLRPAPSVLAVIVLLLGLSAVMKLRGNQWIYSSAAAPGGHTKWKVLLQILMLHIWILGWLYGIALTVHLLALLSKAAAQAIGGNLPFTAAFTSSIAQNPNAICRPLAVVVICFAAEALFRRSKLGGVFLRFGSENNH